MVDQRIPGEPQHGHAVVAHLEHVNPLLPQPIGRGVGVEYVGFGVHHRFVVAPVILLGDLVPAPYVLGWTHRSVGLQDVLVTPVIVIAHDLVAGGFARHKPVKLRPCEAIVHQIQQRVRVRHMRIKQVKRDEALLVSEHRFERRRGLGFVNEFGGLGLHDYAIGPACGDCLRAQDTRCDAMLDRGDEPGVGFELFVPRAFLGRHLGGDEDLVDRGVIAHPRIALRYCPAVAREQQGQIGVLEIANPVGQAEVEQVEDRHDVQSLHFVHHQIGEVPVIPAGPQEHAMDRQPVAQYAQAKVAGQCQILRPAFVMAAFVKQVAAGAAIVDGRVGAFDAGGEHEVAGLSGRQSTAVLSRPAAMFVTHIMAVGGSLYDVEKALGRHAASRKRSAVRSATAMMVSAGLTASALGKMELSQMVRLGTSHARQSASTTEVSALTPIRHVPMVWA